MKQNPNEELDMAFEQYFRTSPQTSNDLKEDYLEKEEVEKLDKVAKQTESARQHAKGNISDIDQVGELLRELLNAAWGSDWGVISPDYPLGEDPQNTKLPAITYDIISRETSKGFGSSKPTLKDEYPEIVDGKPTGDLISIYSQFFDCLIEFNIWGKSSKETRETLNRFEFVMSFYTGYLKESGIQEMFFLKEIPAKNSIHYLDDFYMKPIIYFMRLERKSFVRQSTFQKIKVEVLEQVNSTDEKTSVDIFKL